MKLVLCENKKLRIETLGMKIYNLLEQINLIDTGLKNEANKAVNQLLTIRNWLIGYYIVVYEQNGEDRADYGKKLLQTLSEKLDKKGLSYRNLRLFRQFYQTFPEIGQLLTAKSSNLALPIWQTVSALLENKFQTPDSEHTNTLEMGSAQFNNFEQTSAEFSEEVRLLSSKMLQSLSFSHITLLLPLDNRLQRTFYAIEAIKGIWSVNELKRQINSLLFERSGLSKKPELLIGKINKNLNTETKSTLVKDVYTFEFLGLPIKNAVEETELETALLEHLREFILELGNGFCLEARQKRILIGDEYFFIDLVFYHRLLKCHILIELKVEAFNHVNAGQLNTYINYYKQEVKQKEDNDPIGILMVAGKNDALVEYAIAGMDKNLFVSKYLLQLPSKEKLEAFLKTEFNEL